MQAQIVVAYPTITIEVTLDIAPGEVIALIGPNGTGKSTALRAISGLTPLSAGRIEIGGVTVDDPTRGILVSPQERRVGMLFQDYRLFPHLSALENVMFPLRCRGVARREARERASQWLDQVGLGASAHHRPSALSGGQAQRVALARALAGEPHVLLLDEPLSALDTDASMQLRALLGDHLRAFAGAAVVVSHDEADVDALTQRKVILSR
jgi:molybdate transport system ATP-binding protein